MQQRIPSQRKKPQQIRSKAMVDKILSAAEKLLLEVGINNLSTNKIAKQAGISVGSLYQYFPNKESIVAQLADHHIEQMSNQLEQVFQTFNGLTLHEMLRCLAHTALALYVPQNTLWLQLRENMGPTEVYPGTLRLWEKMRELFGEYLDQANIPINAKNQELAVYIATTSGGWLIREAMVHPSSTFTRAQLIDEFVNLIARYLTAE